VVITQLDKIWVRAATAKQLRQGTLQRQPCELCGVVETQYQHIDYKAPGRLRWLCRRHWNEESLSELQRSLLHDGLLAYYRSRPLDLACGLPDPGHFGLKEIMTQYKDRRERARRRAAAGLAVKRLINRGLLERCSRGSWCLSRAGVALARCLYPELKPITKRQLAHNIALHQAMQSRLAGKRCSRTGKGVGAGH
jgi:hypothetical protein